MKPILTALCASAMALTFTACHVEYRPTQVVCDVKPFGFSPTIAIIDWDETPEEQKEAIKKIWYKSYVIRSRVDLINNADDLSVFESLGLDLSDVDFSKNSVLLCYQPLADFPVDVTYRLLNVLDNEDYDYILYTTYVYDKENQIPDGEVALVRTAVLTEPIPDSAKVDFQFPSVMNDWID